MIKKLIFLLLLFTHIVFPQKINTSDIGLHMRNFEQFRFKAFITKWTMSKVDTTYAGERWRFRTSSHGVPGEFIYYFNKDKICFGVQIAISETDSLAASILYDKYIDIAEEVVDYDFSDYKEMDIGGRYLGGRWQHNEYCGNLSCNFEIGYTTIRFNIAALNNTIKPDKKISLPKKPIISVRKQ